MNALTRKATAALGTALTAASVLVALGGTAANAGADVTPNNSGTIETGSRENLPPDQLALLESDQLKRVSIDPATGDITAVHPMTSAELQSEISSAKSGAIQTFSVGTNCSLNATPCWYGTPPSVNDSFSSGVTDGTWSNRKNFWTGTNFFAKLCWVDPFGGAFPATICMPERNGPNAWIELGYAVTGKKTDISITRG